MQAPIFSVGVDLGGTWIRVDAVDASGRHVRSLKSPAPDLKKLPVYLKKHLRPWNLRPRHLTVGSRGVWTPAERGRLKRSLRGLAERVHVMSDVEAAWHAAFRRSHSGIMVIAGTGSIAYGRDLKGRVRRAGGLGPLTGDEGSAFWIGKTWLDLKPKRLSRHTVRRVAGLAPRVLKKATSGHTKASAILAQAQHHLAETAIAAARPLRFQGRIPISWGGSVLDNADFRKGFASALRKLGRAAGRSFKIIPPRMSASTALAKLPTSDV